MDPRDRPGPRVVGGAPDDASQRPTPLGRCGCGVHVDAASFRDRLSYRKWWIRPACQDCQDQVYLARHPDTGARPTLRRGAVIATRDQDFAALPFVWTVPGGPYAWEARHAVRVGPNAREVDPYDALESMRSALHHHQVDVLTAPACWDGVAYRLRALDVVATLDAQTLSRARVPHCTGIGARLRSQPPARWPAPASTTGETTPQTREREAPPRPFRAFRNRGQMTQESPSSAQESAVERRWSQRRGGVQVDALWKMPLSPTKSACCKIVL